jgi:Xaa-Pro dipeptidase
MQRIPGPITAPPSKEELASRLDRVRRLMAKHKLDCYVSFNPVNIYYLTNFANYVHERPFILLIPREGPLTMLAPLLETEHVRTRARCDLEIDSYFEFPAPEGRNWYDHYQRHFEEDVRLGIEPMLPVEIADRTPGTKIVADIIQEVRLVKSEYEIGRNVHACEVINLGHEKLFELCRPGVTEGFLHGEVSKVVMGKILHDIPAFNVMVTRALVIVSPPSMSHDPHKFPTVETKMEAGGPHVSIVGAQVDGYAVELERTFFLGSVPDKARAPFGTMMRARALAYEMSKPGAVFGEVDRAVRQVITDAGYGDRMLHRTGHGLGITGHEAPFLAEGDDRRMVPGMMVSIEPGIYIPGLGGFRHSDSVLVTEDGCVSLTKAPAQLEELTLPV